MSKREARSFAAAGVDIDAPRAKRRKEAPATSNASPDSKQKVEATHANGDLKNTVEVENTESQVEDRETVRENGLKLWQTLKDAVNKDGQIASFQFMRLPSKRQYPDYYVQIKHPIALDDIKSKLEDRQYASLKDVYQDLETCFRNAKRYNMKESQIFKDAKFLHKLATKEYDRMSGNKEGGHDDDGSDDEAKKKKAPTAYRLLKTRLQKLVDKTDESGRVLSTIFMELPKRKEWPMYYTIIKKPQCLENIFKKLKRKEYPKPIDFANDVELVFSNALEFNQEHTQIWEDAVTLRDYFRKLMSDLPEPFAIPAYATAGDRPTKIKLKVPQATATPTPITASTSSLPSSNSITVPGYRAASSNQAIDKKDNAPVPSGLSPRPPTAVKSPSIHFLPVSPAPAPVSSQPSTSSNTSRTSALAPTPSTPAIAPQAQKPAHIVTPILQTLSPSHAPALNRPSPFHADPHVYQHPVLAPVPLNGPSISPAVPTTNQSAAVKPAVTPVVARPSPQPPAKQYAHPLKHAMITTVPHCRRLILDHTAGVRTWAMRLSGGEAGVIVSDLTFFNHSRGDDEEDSSEDEDPHRQEEEEEEEEEDEEEEAAPLPEKKKRGRGRPRKRRGRQPVAAIVAVTPATPLVDASPKKSSGKGKAPQRQQLGPVELLFNGTTIASREDHTWAVQVPFGLSVLEMGEKGEMMWKVYLDRAAS